MICISAFGEMDLIGHPFNLINKTTLLIADQNLIKERHSTASLLRKWIRPRMR
ncbi:MAG: hypothetical protein IPP22_08850 [Nitrosomonas sp.]|nr:hypothetical protein [Nitrosomonas sp.]